MKMKIDHCSMKEKFGDEENGKGENFMRPVVLIRKFNKNICLVAPTSTKLKENPYYHKISYQGQEYSVLLSHLRTIDTKRLKKRIARLSVLDFNCLVQKILEMVFRQDINPKS
jgi:mRNA interferase MazF